MHGKSPGRFKFTLKDDYEFNYSVIIDVLYLESKPVLQAVDSATAFQAARFLKDMSARTTWDTLRACWIDTYLGPLDMVVHDAGKNFTSTEFKQLARSMAVDVKEVPVEAHNSIGLVERYHAPLRRSYEIIRDELKDEHIDKEMILQMAVKAVNDSVGPNGLVPTLLVFGAYPRLTEMDPPSPSVTKRAEAIRAATKEVRRLHAVRQVQEALAIRNGPNTMLTLDLPLQSDVRVWREKDGWNGPYKLLAINGETCTIDMPYGPTNFRTTVVKPYFTEAPTDQEVPEEQPVSEQIPQEQDQDQDLPKDTIRVIPQETTPQETVRRRPGRPKGSRNVRKNDHYSTTTLNDQFTTRKEQADMELAIKLRRNGLITTPGKPFERSQQQEIDSLIA
jgi:hypothetical protein